LLGAPVSGLPSGASSGYQRARPGCPRIDAGDESTTLPVALLYPIRAGFLGWNVPEMVQTHANHVENAW
jgi:hypothetical protein